VRDEYLEVLYRIVKALETDIEMLNARTAAAKGVEISWKDFIEETYGCLSDDPIERGDQGTFEIRRGIE
jgi:hypothetical protein